MTHEYIAQFNSGVDKSDRDRLPFKYGSKRGIPSRTRLSLELCNQTDRAGCFHTAISDLSVGLASGHNQTNARRSRPVNCLGVNLTFPPIPHHATGQRNDSDMSQGKRQRQRRREFLRNQDRRLVNMLIADLRVDPARFQYKLSACSATGSVNSLALVSHWSYAAEGVLDVWLDPVDGQTYVVNGHNRLHRAKELGIKTIGVKYLPARSATEAREQGAIANIAAGCGTALDAARFFRDGRWDRQRCNRHGIRLAGSIASDGLAIAKLCPELFDRALSGMLPEKRAAILGAAGLAEDQQIALATAISDRESKGKDCSDGVIRELVAIAKVSATIDTVEQTTLFGLETFSRSLIFETAEVQAAIVARLAADKRLYRAAIRGADTLEDSKVASVDREAGQTLADRARAMIDHFRIHKVSAPIAGIIQGAARAIGDGDSKAAAIESAYMAIVDYLRSVV